MNSLVERVSITVRHVTTTEDGIGNTSESVTTTTIDNVLFEPQQSTERTDPRSPGVTTPAKFYVRQALPLNADDEIICDGVTWQVVGKAAVWGSRTEIPVKRTSGA